MGETRVDLQHLLEDLRDAYTGAIEETILTEVVANALDSGATRIQLLTSRADATLTVIDDGRGMQRRELARYHDVAASSKTRGEGIGFAGVGIKLGLLISREVVTETRRGATHVATRWHLGSRHRAPWKWIPPPGLVATRGTAVRLSLSNPLSTVLDAGYLEEAVRRHFEPLLDATFDQVLRRHYPHGVTIAIDGQELPRGGGSLEERATVSITMGRRRTPSVIGFIARDAPAASDREGIAISTFGKVIRRGWDWLGLTPVAGQRFSGVIEAPELAGCLTLSKNDFIRTGPRGASYLAYRKAIQEVVSRQLAAWGDSHDRDARPRVARLERDLERVLEDLADDFPLLRSLVERRAGGQKRLPMPGHGSERVAGTLFAHLPADDEQPGDERDTPANDALAVEASGDPHPEPPPDAGESSLPPEENEPTEAPPQEPHSTDHVGTAPGDGTVSGRRRPARYGLQVQFESRPDDSELGRLVDSTVWINDAHPAYTRAVSSRALGYHTALTVALALAPLAVEARNEHAFLVEFLAQWGAASSSRQPPKRKRRPHRLPGGPSRNT